MKPGQLAARWFVLAEGHSSHSRRWRGAVQIILLDGRLLICWCHWTLAPSDKAVLIMAFTIAAAAIHIGKRRTLALRWKRREWRKIAAFGG